MADSTPDPFERDDAAERLRRDFERRRRRHEPHFWHSVALIGSVGWPIVLLSAGGGALGRYFDAQWNTGVRFTLMLLALGAAIGTWMAFRAVREDT